MRRKLGNIMSNIHYREEDWYPEARLALEEFFKNRGYYSSFTILGGQKGIKPTDEHLRFNQALKQYRRYLPVPDIMGSVWRKDKLKSKLVIAELKLKPKFTDIFKTKGYHELFNAHLTFLIGIESISESSPAYEYIKNNPSLTRVKKTKIVCVLLHPVREGGYSLARLGSESLFDWDEDIDRLDGEFD
jgi:hypothetical protein